MTSSGKSLEDLVVIEESCKISLKVLIDKCNWDEMEKHKKRFIYCLKDKIDFWKSSLKDGKHY